MTNLVKISLTVNGELRILETPPNRTLLDLLREDLGLTGAKNGCGVGECGACTVIMNGVAINSCLVFAPQADGCTIETIEGLQKNDIPHPLQKAFIDAGAVQCGYCTPGMIMSAKALLEKIPNPSDDEIREALSGNLCRCTGYTKIIDAVHLAAEAMRK
jgi:carbon-monoxide dehydrogenase small subunit